MGQLLHAISCRSEEVSIYDKEKLPPNRYLTLALGGSFALQLLTFVFPWLRNLLGLAPVNLFDGAIIAISSILPLLVNEATKGTAAKNEEQGAQDGALSRLSPCLMAPQPSTSSLD
jgi:Ca2+-transporting ATPase